MERDFLSLSIKQPVKEQPTPEAAMEIEAHWPSSKIKPVMPIMSPFSSSHEEIIGKMKAESLAAPLTMNDSLRRTHLSEIQFQKFSSQMRRDGSLLSLNRGSEAEYNFRKPLNPASSSSNADQLTIFYAGKVNVYDGVSAAKAQEIMSRAKELSKLHFSKPSAAEFKPKTISPRSNQSVASNNVPASQEETSQPKPLAPLEPSEGKRSSSSTAVIILSVPQSRKASLARFLEKRKERMITAAPYFIKNDTSGISSVENTHSGNGITPLIGHKEENLMYL